MGTKRINSVQSPIAQCARSPVCIGGVVVNLRCRRALMGTVMRFKISGFRLPPQLWP